MKCSLDFRPGRGTIDAIFIVPDRCRKKFLAKKSELWMAFVDLQKASSIECPEEIM